MSKKPHSHTTAALAKRRAELIADNQAMRERIRLNDGYIKSLDTAMGLMDPAFDPGTVLPKRQYTKKFDRGELKSLIIRTLKAADGGPLSTRAITDQVMEHKGMTDDCRTEVRRALLHYDVVEKVDGDPDDHMEYWALVGYAATTKQANDKGDEATDLRLLK
ncbi:hypothetical protein [Desulfovibrio sp. Fe33]|uniref:hypothetical protein n=1 Tax=Desulfovibrio sp. Fe33 TaxID=3020842 RepID=UPI00234D6CCB|nr:hypothetical protein [Desulfovibrio sp. Fe33]